MDPEIADSLMFKESVITGFVDDWDASMIVGHTHDPKLVRSPNNDDVCYVNSGTSGWWEGCVWTVEITAENIRLVGWTEDDAGDLDRTYVVGLHEPTDGEPFDPSDPDQKVTDATF